MDENELEALKITTKEKESKRGDYLTAISIVSCILIIGLTVVIAVALS